MRLFVVSVSLLLLVACHHSDNSSLSLTAPSGLPQANATAILRFGPAVPVTSGFYSLTVTGKNANNELMDSRFLTSPMSTGESWAGAVIRALVVPKGFAAQTNNVFGGNLDHYQFDKLPLAGNSQVDLAFQIIPGGDNKPPFHVIELAFTSDNSQTNLAGVSVAKQSDGHYHLTGTMP